MLPSAIDMLQDSRIMSRISLKTIHILHDVCHLPVKPVFSIATTMVEEKILDNRGDLWLVVDNSGAFPATEIPDIVKFKVCSRTVARNSPVLERMLYGNFREAQRDSNAEWTTTLYEEDAGDLENLLRLWHGDWKQCRLARLPTSLNMSGDEQTFVDDLYGLVTVADKYDCIETLEPFVDKWVRLVADVRSTNTTIMKKLVWIYYHLGLQKKYQAVVTDLVKNIPANGAVDLEFFSDEEQNEEAILEPLGLSSKIQDIRFHIVKDLLARTERLTRLSHTNANQYCSQPDASHEEQLECMARLRNAIIPQLRIHHLWPIPEDPKKVTLTAVELERIITRIRHSPGTIHGARYNLSRHGGCYVRSQPGQDHERLGAVRSGDASMRREAGAVSAEAYVYKLTEGERKHFASLAGKLGLPSSEELP